MNTSWYLMYSEGTLPGGIKHMTVFRFEMKKFHRMEEKKKKELSRTQRTENISHFRRSDLFFDGRFSCET